RNTALTSRWEAEKATMGAVKQIQEQIDRKQTEFEQAQRQGNWEAAARIQYGELRDLKAKLESAEKRVRERSKDGKSLVKDEVTAEEIAEVVSRWTGVPVSRMLEGEKEKLIQMEERLAARVVGQEDAVKAVSNAVR